MTSPNVDQRVVIYPAYINKKKTQAEGRRISVAKGCEDPLATEIFDVVRFLKLPCELEMHKSYSREWWTQGRVRVVMKKADGMPLSEEIPSRKALFLEVARLLPMHSNRQPKPNQKEGVKPTTSTAKSGKHQGGKKGGKKGRK